jgi:signal transduction histidine kinase
MQNARLFAELENADRLKSEFVSTVSHELRTPLNVIIGYTEMLRDGAVGVLSHDQRDLIERLDTRGRELLDLVEATLQVNRLEAGRDQVSTTPIALAELVRALDVSTAGLPRHPDVSFEWRLPQAPGAMIRTDRAKLALIVRNLVGNAFKFTSTGKVEVRLVLVDDLLTVEVEDTGIGIPADQVPIIFDMFRQVDGSETRKHNGVGLGLYIVKQFVSRLGGRIEVASTPGSGSTFRVAFPGAVVTAGERVAA